MRAYINDTWQAQKVTSACRELKKMHARERNPNESYFVRAPINAFFIFLSLLPLFFRRSSSSERLRNSRTRSAWSRRSESERRRKKRRGGSNSGRKLLSLAIKRRRNTREQQQQPAPWVVIRNCDEESPFRSLGVYSIRCSKQRAVAISTSHRRVRLHKAFKCEGNRGSLTTAIVRRATEVRIEAPWYNYAEKKLS